MERSHRVPTFDTRPLLVFWETTRACPLACRHCRASAQREPLRSELSPSEGLRLIDDITGFGQPAPILIFTGGDCLQRKDLPVLMRRARDHRIPMAVSPSVSSDLTPVTLQRLKDDGASAISISLDGAHAETHDNIRGIPRHFDATLDAMRNAVAAGLRVQVNTTVMRDSVEELAGIAAILQRMNVHIWEVFFLITVGRGDKLRDISPQEYEEVCHFLVEASRYSFLVRTVEAPFFRRIVQSYRHAPDTPGPHDHLSSRLVTRLHQRLGPPLRSLRAPSVATRDGKGIIFVGHDGDIFPSGFMPSTLGNVRTDSLQTIYRDHPLLRQIRAADFSGRCGRCEFRDLCGGSRARAFATTGDPLAEDPACIYQPAA